MKHLSQKRILNKKGAALAYVLGVSMLLLVLCSALMVVARYNLSGWSKGVDGRQAFITADSAIEFAKSHIYKMATSTASQISIGAPNVSFFVEKNSENDFSISTSVTPTADKLAAECELELEKTENVLVQITKLWNEDGTPFTEAIEGKWTLADYSQEHTAIAPAEPSDVFTEFDLSWLPEGAIMQVSYDEFKRYTYDAEIDANVKYKNSNRSQTESYSCKVIPGSAVKHTVKPPVTGEVYIGEAWGWVATGMNYGDTRIADKGGYSNGIVRPPSNHNDTITIKSEINSKYPVLYSLTIGMHNNHGVINAPNIYFKGIIYNDISGAPCICFGDNGSLTLNTNYVSFSEAIINHGNKRSAKLLLKEGTIVCIDRGSTNRTEMIIKKIDGWGNNNTFNLPVGYYRCKKDLNMFDLTSQNVNSSLELISNLDPTFEEKEELAKKYKIPFNLDYLLLKSKYSTTNNGINSSESNLEISPYTERSDGCQWTYKGSVYKYPRMENDIGYRKTFYPSRVLWTATNSPSSFANQYTTGNPGNFYEVGHNEIVSNGSDRITFAYIDDVENWGKVEALEQNQKRLEYIYFDSGIFLQYDNKKDFVIPKNRTITFDVQSYLQIGMTQKSKIVAEDSTSELLLAFSRVGTDRKLIIPQNIQVSPNRAGVSSYTIKAGTYDLSEKNENNDSLIWGHAGDVYIYLFSNEAKEFFENAKADIKPGQGGGSGGGETEVDPPADGGETPDTTYTQRLASFTEGQYEK